MFSTSGIVTRMTLARQVQDILAAAVPRDVYVVASEGLTFNAVRISFHDVLTQEELYHELAYSHHFVTHQYEGPTGAEAQSRWVSEVMARFANRRHMGLKTDAFAEVFQRALRGGAP